MKRGRDEHFTLEDENLKLIEICRGYKNVVLHCPLCDMPCDADEDENDLSCASGCGQNLPCTTWFEQYHDMEPFPQECEMCNALFCVDCYNEEEKMCKDCLKEINN